MKHELRNLEVPSGRVFDPSDLSLLKMMAEYGFIRMGEKPFRLKSGIDSHVYVFGREDVTDNPVFEYNLGLKILKDIKTCKGIDKKQVCLIGIPTAGTPIAQAASMASYKELVGINDLLVCHRVMREKLKTGYGVHPKWVNGDPNVKHSYWSVDNVITDGASKLEANQHLEESGYFLDGHYILVDRQQGGVDMVRQAGLKNVVVGYYLLDIVFAFGEMELWPKNMVSAVEQEIKAHQFQEVHI